MWTPVALSPFLRRRAATIALVTLLSGVGSSTLFLWHHRMTIFYWRSSAESESFADPRDPFGFLQVETEYHLHYSKRVSWLPGPDRISLPIDGATFDQLRTISVGEAKSVCGEEWIGLYFAPPRFPAPTPSRLAECYDLPESALPLLREGRAREERSPAH